MELRRPGRVIGGLGLAAIVIWLVHIGLVLLAFWTPVWIIRLGLPELLEWRTPVAAVALLLFAAFVVLATPRHRAMADGFVGLLLLSNVILELAVVFAIGHFLTVYSGLNLGIVVARLSVSVVLSLTLVWGLFLGAAWVRWISVGAAVAWLFLVSWAPAPNSPKFREWREEIESRPAQELSSNVRVTSLTYPEPVHYGSYLGVFGYAFFGGWFMTRKNPGGDARA